MKIRNAVFLHFCFVVLAGSAAWGQLITPTETRNAALRYWQAVAEMKDPPTDVPTREAMEKIVWRDAEWDEAKLGAIITQNEEALGIMQRATKLPDCDWGLEYSQGPWTSIAMLPRAHVLARLNTLYGIRELSLGHTQAAVDAWIAGFRFSEDLAKGGSMAFAAAARGNLREKMHTLAYAVNQGRFNASQKKQLRAAISAMREDGVDWSLAWQMESLGMHVLAVELRQSAKPKSFYESLMGDAAPGDCLRPTDEQLKPFDAYLADIASALKLPPPAAKQRIAELEGKKQTICEALRRAIPNASRSNDERADTIAQRKSLLDALGQ